MTPFLEDATPVPPAPEKKERARSPSPTKTKTPARRDTLAPDDLPITPELEAWRDAEAPGLDLSRAIKKFLLYARTKGTTNADWTAAFCFYTLTGLERQAALTQEQQAAAARRAAWQAQRRAKEAAQAAPDDQEWADPRAHASMHLKERGGCGQVHQRGKPCNAPWI